MPLPVSRDSFRQSEGNEVIQATEEMTIALATRGLSGLLEVIDRDYVKRLTKLYVRVPVECVQDNGSLIGEWRERFIEQAKYAARSYGARLVSEEYEYIPPHPNGKALSFSSDCGTLVFEMRRK